MNANTDSCLNQYLSNTLKLNRKPRHRITRSYGFLIGKLSIWCPGSSSCVTKELFFSPLFWMYLFKVKYSCPVFFLFFPADRPPPCPSRRAITIFSRRASTSPSRDFSWYVSSSSLFTALENKIKYRFQPVYFITGTNKQKAFSVYFTSDLQRNAFARQDEQGWN